MKTVFYERLQAILFAIHSISNRDLENWESSFPVMRKEWHAVLRSIVTQPAQKSGYKLVYKTSNSWIDPIEKNRHEPRYANHSSIIYLATRRYAKMELLKNNVTYNDANIDSLVGRFLTEDLLSILARLRISGSTAKKVFPILAHIAEFVDPSTYVRDKYDGYSSSDVYVKRIEDYLVQSSFYVYRFKAIGHVIFRCMLNFSRDPADRLICSWDVNRDVVYEGTAYVSHHAISASLVRKTPDSAFEMAFLKISFNPDVKEWPGLYLGLTDGGYDPCSGRLLIVLKEPDAEKTLGALKDIDLSHEQKRKAESFFRLEKHLGMSDYALITDFNMLSKCAERDKTVM